MTFNYRVSPNENHVGFVAEDVPELVAKKDRKGLSSMDIVAVLTRVVQEQQKVLEEQRRLFEQQKETTSVLAKELRELKGELTLRGGLIRVENLLR